METKERCYEYDLLRVIATIFVVIGHSAYLSIHTGLGGVTYTLPQNLASAYTGGFISFFRWMSGWVYSFHMPLFFFLSGLVYALGKKTTFDEVCIKKLKRLVAPYFLAGIFFMFPVKFLGNFYNLHSAKQAIASFFIGGESGHLWFLLSLFWVFLVYFIFEKITKGSMFATFLLCFFTYFFYKKIPWDFMGFKSGMSYMVWFGFGVLIHKVNILKKVLNKKERKMFMMGGGILISFLAIIEQRYIKATFGPHVIINCIWFLTICIIISNLFPKLFETKIFKMLSKKAFYIYLFHDPLEYIVLRFAFHFDWLTTNIGCYIYIFLRIVGVIFCSIFFGRITDCFIYFTKRKLEEL